MGQRVQEIALAVFAVSAAVVVGGQTRLPPDIKADSLSRLPLVQRAQLDAEGQRIWDHIGGARGMPKTGPAPVSMYSPKAAAPIHELNQYLRTTVAGSRYFELSALIAAREFDQQYEWSGHEPAAVRAGLPQAAIDAVKFNRDVTGLEEKDATVIRLGRALLRDHKVSPELWAKTVELFGPQGAVEIPAIIGDYVMAGLMLTAVDQQLPPERKPLLPVK
jgi:4-carboxymuconolactone decarboxylase